MSVWLGCVSALGIALAGWVGGGLGMRRAVQLDGHDAGSYDAGNRAAILFGYMASTVGTMAVAVICFLVALAVGRARYRALPLVVGLTPCLLAVFVVPWWWNR